jgi:methylated-DNA-[protein]-cysteine S-methyltransferase
MPESPPAEMSLFPTAIGFCGVAWSGDTVRATHLPEAAEAKVATRLAARVGGAASGAPSSAIRRAIDAMTALLGGERTDLGFIVCDFASLEPFAAEVYRLTRAIPPGATLTYGDIASQLGDKTLARAVGRALGRNPFPIIVPCHRVLGASGRLTGFSADGGIETKLRMLAIEGAQIGAQPALFDSLPLQLKQGRHAP